MHVPRPDLRERAAFWRLGLMEVDQLRDVAYEALGAGLDCQEIRQIAGDARLDTDEARELFPRALRALGTAMPSEEESRQVVTLSVARSILSGAIDPLWGADLIGGLHLEEQGPEHYGPLVYYSCDCCNGLDEMVDPADRERRRAECRADIRGHLARILPFLEEKAGVPRPPGVAPPEDPGFLGWRHEPDRTTGGDLAARIRAILVRIWDPIGVSHEALAQDEYDGYIPGVKGLLRGGATVEALSDHLREIEADRMGLETDGNRASRTVAAQELLALVASPEDPRPRG